MQRTKIAVEIKVPLHNLHQWNLWMPKSHWFLVSLTDFSTLNLGPSPRNTHTNTPSHKDTHGFNHWQDMSSFFQINSKFAYNSLKSVQWRKRKYRQVYLYYWIRWAAIDAGKAKKKIIIGCIYKHPTCNLEQFCNQQRWRYEYKFPEI